MKKVLLLLLFLPTILSAQTSICGIDFGSSYSKAEQVLESKFGDKEYLLSDKTKIIFSNKMYAGRMWSRLIFMFQSDGYNQYLNRAILVEECSTASEAKEIRDAIKAQMEEKYFIVGFTDEKSGFKYYLGGESPTNVEKYGFSIEIIKYEYGTVDYGVGINYGPYNYVTEEL